MKHSFLLIPYENSFRKADGNSQTPSTYAVALLSLPWFINTTLIRIFKSTTSTVQELQRVKTKVDPIANIDLTTSG